MIRLLLAAVVLLAVTYKVFESEHRPTWLLLAVCIAAAATAVAAVIEAIREVGA